MESVIEKVFSGNCDEDVHRYFVRFGKGTYGRRFLIKASKGKKIKIKSSFEFANDFVKFVAENKDAKFSGLILSKDKIEGKKGKKKSGGFAYELLDSSLEGFENAYFYLLNVDDEDIVLKSKKKLPKPGKSEKKIDDKFCLLELDISYWERVRKVFFWDVPDCKKVSVEHEIEIREILLPEGVEDPVKMRELAKRKGTIKRKVEVDGEEKVSEKEFVA